MKISLTPDQQSVLQRIRSFIHDSGKQIFILKGAAGSGKTTLIRELVTLLRNERMAFQLMAPTGRAAKILRDKTGYGTTIHRGIYNFDRLEAKETDSDDETPPPKAKHIQNKNEQQGCLSGCSRPCCLGLCQPFPQSGSWEWRNHCFLQRTDKGI